MGDALGVVNMASLQGTENAIENGIILADSLIQVILNDCIIEVELEGCERRNKLYFLWREFETECLDETAAEITKFTCSLWERTLLGNGLCCMNVLIWLFYSFLQALSLVIIHLLHILYQKVKIMKRRIPRINLSNYLQEIIVNMIMLIMTWNLHS